MFGLMNLDNGHIWSSKCHPDISLDDYTYRIEIARVVAIPKDYINHIGESWI